MKFNQTCVYDILRNGVVHKTFSALQSALNYLAAARELCPNDLWQLCEYNLIRSDKEVQHED